MILGILHSFPIYLELTLHRQKTLVLYFNVSGTKRQRNLLEIYGRQYLEGRRTTEKGSEQTEARGPNEHGPRGHSTWPRGTHPFGPRGSVAVDLRSTAFVLT